MQKINLKKTTKEQMLNMLEKAWNANAGAADDIAALSKRIEEQNDALAKCVAEKNELRDQARDARGNAEYWHGRFNNAYNVTEVQRQRIKEDADELRRERVNVKTMTDQRNAVLAESKDLRTKLADAEETLGRTRSVVTYMQGKIVCANDEIVRLKENLDRSESRANWAVSHPWSNLWAWIKRKLFW